MAKKPSKKSSSEKNSKKKETQDIRGLVVLMFACMIALSLLSITTRGVNSTNLLGYVGHKVGTSFTITFGIGSYLICLFLGWIGLRLIFKKSINDPYTKVFSFLLCLGSACILLSLIEDQFPSLKSALSNFFYKDPFLKKNYFHLGGSPSYYIYHDLPHYNLLYVLNALGVGLVFSGSLLTGIMLLANVNPFPWLEKGWELFKRTLQLIPKFEFRSSEQEEEEQEVKPTFKKSAAENKPIIPDPSKDSFQNNDSDFLRYVKLRIPSMQTAQAAPSPDASNPEMLAIQPETNLKTRPSLSKKEQTESKKDIPEPQPEPKTIEPTPKPKKIESSEPFTNKTPTIKDHPDRLLKRENALAAQKVHNGDYTNFKLPSLNLLTGAKKLDHSLLKKDLKRKAEVLEETLLSFGIEAKVGQINCGPTITSFEVHPAIGVKVQKIKTLENDIALNLEAQSIRIIAPIPGKAAVGIEVPNAQPEEVGFKEMIQAYQQEGGRKFRIPILLGKAVNGDYVMSDLTKMPHCIIAGATGSGKSVCINTIVMSILLNAKPDEIKLVMVDPKKVELTPYTRLPHMLAPVITEPQGACAALNWLVKEMERRYDLLKQIGARNIEAFNTRTPDKDFEASLGIEVPEKLPYIVGIVDELADLMMVSSSDIETPIARIAQMARAIGIHLILATQRPSREVITGLIKANFPTRISFKVSSRVNSQIVLDDVGAESLLGNGDMLFLPPGSSLLVRAQGAYIRDEDINAVVKMIQEQAPPRYVIESFDNMGQIELGDMNDEEEEGDALYSQALDIVRSTGNASTTFLQRKLKIGYARAASLIDMLENKGVVGPAEGSKPRKVLVARVAGNSDNDLPEDINE